MTTDMQAGRELPLPFAVDPLDAMVAEKVMGWERLPVGLIVNGVPVQCGWAVPDGQSAACFPPAPWCYSTDIAAAFQVVEKMRERHTLKIWSHPEWRISVRVRINEVTASADTLPLAVCRVALKVAEAMHAKTVAEAKPRETKGCVDCEDDGA